MASPKPSAVVRFSEYTDTSVIDETTYSTRNEPAMATTPDEQREAGGDEAPEHDHQEDERDRERDDSARD